MKQQLIQEIRTALEVDNFTEALQKVQQLVTQNPDDPESLVHYGNVFLEMSNPKKAAEQYEKAVSLRPEYAEAYFGMGKAYELEDNYTGALNQYQSARRLDSSNNLYQAYYGRILHEKGVNDGNVNYIDEGLSIMENAYRAGVRDTALNEQLAIAHLGKATEHWRVHPEDKNTSFPTEAYHLEHTKIHLDWVRNLYDPSNKAVGQSLHELDNLVRINETKSFSGYPYIRKAPLITGGLVLLAGQVIPGVIFLSLGGLYHISQIRPQYLNNRMHFPGEYRPPFIVRRLNKMDEELSGITIFSSSWSGLFFNKFLFNVVFGAIRYGMVIVMLPYEIVKGFWKNHGLREVVLSKVKS